MHELPITEQILSIVLRHAEAAGARRVVSIRLTVGALSDLEGEWIQKYFDRISKETIAHRAMLRIERAPATMTCEDCGRSFEVGAKEWRHARCPGCDGGRCQLVADSPYRIEDMQVL
jgi:hydrogenase nickel incorporation protein HypA/HybF